MTDYSASEQRWEKKAGMETGGRNVVKMTMGSETGWEMKDEEKQKMKKQSKKHKRLNPDLLQHKYS